MKIAKVLGMVTFMLFLIVLGMTIIFGWLYVNAQIINYLYDSFPAMSYEFFLYLIIIPQFLLFAIYIFYKDLN